MRRPLMLTVAALAFIGALDLLKGTWPSAADEPAAPQAEPISPVAVLDLAKIYNNDREFLRLSAELKREVEEAERELVAAKAELTADADALAKLTKGTREAKELESKITRGSADLQVSVQEQKAGFFEREAQIYYGRYQLIMKEVQKYAEARGIRLVMRFNGDPIDLNDPQGIQKELNKAVLYYKDIDITDPILAIVNAAPDS